MMSNEMNRPGSQYSFCGRTRRTFLSNLGLGFGGIALRTLWHQDALGSDASVQPPIALSTPRLAKAKNVIWIFLSGGVSQMETFDPKPLLNTMQGKTYDETTLPNPQKLPIYLNARDRLWASIVNCIRESFHCSRFSPSWTSRFGRERLVAPFGLVRR